MSFILHSVKLSLCVAQFFHKIEVPLQPINVSGPEHQVNESHHMCVHVVSTFFLFPKRRKK